MGSKAGDVTIVHLAVISLIGEDKRGRRGADIREGLTRLGCPMSPPAFYQLAKRMEDAGLIRGHIEEAISERRRVHEKRYMVEPVGSYFRRVAEELSSRRPYKRVRVDVSIRLSEAERERLKHHRRDA